jgi:hypothetical protein
LLIKLGERRDPTYRILPLTNATPPQKQVYRSWVGSEVTR